MAASIGLFILANRMADRPADPLRTRLIPWKLVIILAAFLFLLLLVHAANLLGVETGPDKSPFGRMR